MAKAKRKASPRLEKQAHKKAQYLEAYKKIGGMFKAAEAIGMNGNTVWEWRRDDPEFAAAFNAIDEMDTEELEEVARERAVEKSDPLIMFLLKGKRPAKYRDNIKMEHTGGVTVTDLLLEDEQAKGKGD